MKRIFAILLMAAMCMMTAACAKNPYTGQLETDWGKVTTIGGTAAATLAVGAALYGIHQATR